MIDVINLKKDFGNHKVLKGISLKVEKGDIVVIIGPSGSGKSTYLTNRIKDSTSAVTVISRDIIRFSLVSEDEEYFSKEDEVYNLFIKGIANALNFNNEVFADATHLNERSRAKTLRALGKHLKDVEVNVIYVRVPIEIAIERNENRIGTRAYVPKSVIRRMYSQTTMPIKEEGFEHIYIVDENGKEKEII